MRRYELVAIIKPGLDKDDYEEVKEKISSTISKEQGKIKSWNIWKEKYKFAYPLRSRGAGKKKFTEGTYVLSEVLLDPQKMGALKYTLDLEERIVRYLIINKDAA